MKRTSHSHSLSLSSSRGILRNVTSYVMRFEVRYSVTHPPRLWGRGGSSTQQSSEKKSRENVFSLSSSLLRLLLRWRVFIESFHRSSSLSLFSRRKYFVEKKRAKEKERREDRERERKRREESARE